MRGLGLGIILTTLILSIGGNNKTLSKEEIIARATDYGMVMAEKQKANEVLPSDKVTPELTNVPEATAAPEQDAVESVADSEPTNAPEPTAEPTKAADPAVTTEPDKPIEQADTSDHPSDNGNTDISFTIAGGMSSGKVAKLLYELGLVDNPEEFNKYIVKEGKAEVIRVGTYTAPKGASYEDIMEIITK